MTALTLDTHYELDAVRLSGRSRRDRTGGGATDRARQARTYLNLLARGAPVNSHLLIWGVDEGGFNDGVGVCVPATPGEIAEWATMLDRDELVNGYATTGLMPRITSGRGSAGMVLAHPGPFADIDVPAAWKPKSHHYAPDVEAAWQCASSYLATIGVPLTMAVHSGTGLHVYSLFDEAFELNQGEDRRSRCAAVIQRYQAALRGAFSKEGWTIDSVPELNRLLRLPGTFHLRAVEDGGDGRRRPVLLRTANDEQRLSIEDLERALPPLSSTPRSWPGARTNALAVEDDDRPWPDEPAGRLHPDTLVLLAQGVGAPRAEKYESPSEMLHALVGAMVRANWSFGECVDALLDPLNEGGLSAQKRLERDEETARRHVMLSYNKAIDGLDVAIDVSPAGRDQPDRQEAPGPFPVDALPRYLADQVLEIAEQVEAPVESAAMVVLGVLAAVLQGRARVRVGPNGVWWEPLSLFLLVVLPSGERKSAVFNAMTAPLIELEAELKDERHMPHALALQEREQAEARLKYLNAAAAKENDATRRSELRDELLAAREEVERLVVPVMPRFIVDDVTPEALSSLVIQHGRIAVMSSENVFGQFTERYKKQADFTVLLKGHSGDDLTIDRKGSGHAHVHRPALSMVVMVQPGRLREIVARDDFDDTGLLGRLLIAVPQARAGTRFGPQRDPVPAVRERYGIAIKQLGRAWLDRESEFIVNLDGEAWSAFREWHEDIELRLGPGGDLSGPLISWGSKLAGHVARLAGVLHLAAGGDERITVDTVRSAIAIGDWAISHAKRAFMSGAAQLEQSNSARELDYVVDLIRSRPKLLEGFTARELRRVREDFFKDGRAQAFIDELLAAGRLDERRGGKTTVYVPTTAL